jgi:hypothetical protein
MLLRSPSAVVLGLALGLAASSPRECAAQGTPQRVNFSSYDSVDLRGTFYPGQGNRSPCVIMIHALGENSQKEGWHELALALQKENHAVLTFDLRGHGESTSVGESFWADPINQTLKSYRSAKTKDKITYKDFTSENHYYSLMHDVAAAKRYLDMKNDAQECNSSNVIVVGAESGAALGAGWIYHAHRAYKLKPGLLPGQVVRGNEAEGKDVSCAVWLTMRDNLGTTRLPVAKWLRDVREKVPMAFFFGKDDTKGSDLSKKLFDNTLRANTDKRLKTTKLYPVAGSRSLAGRALLGQRLTTEKDVVEYVKKTVNDRGMAAWSRRETDRIPIQMLRVPVESLR